ncbi:MAG: 30S ribosomal protein S20 [Candidatus Bruticola sp.]
MANIKTAKKMILVHERRRKRNVSVKTRIKNVFKAAAVAIEKDSSAEVLAQSLSTASSVIDKAVAKGIVHKNKAARRKSRLARKINAAQA